MPGSYFCHRCNSKGVKLWRPYGDTKPLLCARCAALETGEDISSMDSTGKHIPKVLPQPTDQIGSFMPAIPHNENRDGFWAYTLVPNEGIKWWVELDTFSVFEQKK